ncbi:sensor domain-containing diguanylate cyclase, partial [Mycobacterium sp. ITM-2017-0098]
GRTRLLRFDNRQVPVEFTVSRIQYSGHPALQAEVRDISADLIDREHLEAIANTDALTRIMNRRAWTARVTSMTTDSVAIAGGLVVAMIDVDHFKAYNDRYGHPAGDELLQEIAQGLQTNVRRCDSVAR